MLYIKNFSEKNKSNFNKEYWGNNYIDNSLQGLVVGGGIAGLGNVLIGDKKKSTIRRFLEGAGVGAIVGAGAGLAYSGLKHKDSQIKSLKQGVAAGNEAVASANADRDAALHKSESVGSRLRAAERDRDAAQSELSSTRGALYQTRADLTSARQAVSNTTLAYKQQLNSVTERARELLSKLEKEGADKAQINEELKKAYATINDLRAKIDNDAKAVEAADQVRDGHLETLNAIRTQMLNGNDVLNLSREIDYYDPSYLSEVQRRVEGYDKEDARYAQIREAEAIAKSKNVRFIPATNNNEKIKEKVAKDRNYLAAYKRYIDYATRLGYSQEDAQEMLMEYHSRLKNQKIDSSRGAGNNITIRTRPPISQKF